jgi:hypothetical protein
VIGNEVVIGADFSVLLDGIYAIDNLALGIEEATLQNVSLYPNPAKEKVTIANGSNAAVSYELITIDGQLIQSGTIGVGTTDLSLDAIAEGIYFVRLGSTDLRKLIIKK